jgi:hypothetical protein
MQVKGGMQKSECVLHFTLITRICTQGRQHIDQAGNTHRMQAIHAEYLPAKMQGLQQGGRLRQRLGGKKCNMRLNRHMYSDLPICLIGMMLYTATKIPFMYSFSGNFHIHVSVSDLYIFPGSVHIFSCSN